MKKTDKDKSLISFIIPAYNEEKYIAETIRSIKSNAPYYPCQIIVVDNGSTDGTAQIVESEEAVLIKHPKGTIASARNKGVASSDGDVLVFLDADVIVTPQWKKEFEKTKSSLSNNPMIVTGSRCDVQDKQNWLARYWFSRMQNVNSNYINSGHMITSRALFSQIGGFNENLHTAEDYDFCYRARRKGAKIINNPMLHVIHTGYPIYLKEFIARERWHGSEDFSSLQKSLSSKVALAAILNVVLTATLLTMAIINMDIYYVLTYLLFIYILSGISTLMKFGFGNPLLFLATSTVFYFYYVGRSLALIDGIKRIFNQKK